MNYSQAVEKLGNRSSLKLELNTWLEPRDNGDIAIRLWNTDIILFHPDNTVTLRTGGYQTVITKRRINAYTTANVNQAGGPVPFYDGMTLDHMGRIRKIRRSA